MMKGLVRGSYLISKITLLFFYWIWDSSRNEGNFRFNSRSSKLIILHYFLFLMSWFCKLKDGKISVDSSSWCLKNNLTLWKQKVNIMFFLRFLWSFTLAACKKSQNIMDLLIEKKSNLLFLPPLQNQFKPNAVNRATMTMWMAGNSTFSKYHSFFKAAVKDAGTSNSSDAIFTVISLLFNSKTDINKIFELVY